MTGWRSMHGILLFILCLTASGVAAAPEPLTISLLKDTRSELTVIPYTPEERVFVAQQAQNLFSIYVNREAKIDYYGKDFPEIDPVPRIAELVSKATNLTDMEFHEAMSTLFLTLRDKHTNYYIPGPYACYFAVMPIFFDFINSVDLERLPSLAIKRFARFSKILELSGDDLEKVSIGDILLRVNGESFRSYYQKNKWMANGANEYGGMRSVADHMSSRAGLLNMMPVEDHMVFELFSITKLRSYTVKFPWIVVRDNGCFLKSYDLIHNITGAPIPRVPSQKGLNSGFDSRLLNSFKPSKHIGTKKGVFYQSVPFPHLREALFPRGAEAAKVDIKNTTDPAVDWAIYNKGESNMGIIYLRSFMPLKDDAPSVLLLIRSLLVNQLKDTDSLLFDIRDNGGGLVTMADGLPQFFIKDFVNPGFRALVSPINENIFLKSFAPSDLFHIAYSQVAPGDMYTMPVPLSGKSNNFGTAYTKPVGVLNNANCYSACDLFSGNMQDSGAAIIFGEDGATGAGGANVIEHNDYLVKADASSFKPLPYSANLTSGAPNFRVGWRQQIRNGKNAGKLIEDFGVVPNYIVRPHVTDLLPNATRLSQYDRIARLLRREGSRTQRNFIFFNADPQIEGEERLGSPISFNVTSSGITRLTLTDFNHTLLGEKHIRAYQWNRNNFAFESTAPSSAIGNFKYTIQGYRDAHLVVHTHRYIRTIPALESYAQVAHYKPFEWDFKPNPAVGIYDVSTVAGTGWQYNPTENCLMIGNGTEYANDVNSKASIFVKIPEDLNAKLFVSAKFDTEDKFDFLFIGYLNKDGERVLLKEATGTGEIKEEFKLENVGPTAEVFLEFSSDQAVVATGVKVTKVKIY